MNGSLKGMIMMSDNVVLEKSKDFAVRIIRLYQYLNGEKRENVLSKQLLRSGTSIGANAHEAVGASSRKDFLTDAQYESMAKDCDELYRILSSITKSTKEN